MLARFLEFSGEYYTVSGNLPEAVKVLQRAHGIRGMLANESGRERMALRECVLPGYLLAGVFERQRDYPRAVGYYNIVIVLQETLPDLFPEDPGYRNEVAWRGRGIGNMLWRFHALPDAERAYRQSLGHFARLAQIKPDDPDPLRQQAVTLQYLGHVYLDWTKPDAAVECFEQAIAIRQRLISSGKATPKVADDNRASLARHRRSLADALIQQGRALWAKGDKNRAHSNFESAWNLLRTQAGSLIGISKSDPN
jgi:tetratricopeptide (TPR) repeat protein